MLDILGEPAILSTEDEVKHAEKELQKLTDDYVGKIDQHLAHKEKEILTV